MVTFNELNAIILEHYVSFDTPDFRSIRKVMERCPYSSLIEELKTRWVCVEDTDVDYDVSFGFIVSLDTQYFLQLSALGRFAVLTKISPFLLNNVFVDSITNNQKEQDLVSLLEKYGFVFLSKLLLEKHVPLTLVNIDPGCVCVYQALFSDGELPWSEKRI